LASREPVTLDAGRDGNTIASPPVLGSGTPRYPPQEGPLREYRDPVVRETATAGR